MRIRPIVSLLFVLILAAAVVPAAATSAHTFVDATDPAARFDTEAASPHPSNRTSLSNADAKVVGDLGEGEATAINTANVVAGHTDGVPWVNQYGERTALETKGGPAWPEAINDAQLVVGSAQANGQRHAVLWRSGSMELLPDLGGTSARATDINQRGEIVGVVTDADGVQRAAYWLQGRLTLLPDDGAGGIAHGVNKRGDIVGAVRRPRGNSFDQLAVLWRNGELIDLRPMLDQWSESAPSVANDIGDSGHIVGEAYYSYDDYYNGPGFRLDPDGEVTYLRGGYYSVPLSVNRYGVTVGFSRDEMLGSIATVWDPGGSPRGEWLPPYGGSKANDINGGGRVVGATYTARWLDPQAVTWQLQ